MTMIYFMKFCWQNKISVLKQQKMVDIRKISSMWNSRKSPSRMFHRFGLKSCQKKHIDVGYKSSKYRKISNNVPPLIIPAPLKFQKKASRTSNNSRKKFLLSNKVIYSVQAYYCFLQLVCRIAVLTKTLWDKVSENVDALDEVEDDEEMFKNEVVIEVE